MNQRTHQGWREYHRDWLRELCAAGKKDHEIAAVMKRTVSAVNWQRRKLRIKIGARPVNTDRKPSCPCCGTMLDPAAAAVLEGRPKVQPRNVVDYGEDPRKIRRLMELAGCA